MSYGMTSGALSRGRTRRLQTIVALAITAVAMLALSIGSSTASAAFTATSFSGTPTGTLQAGGHPTINLNASVDPVAGDLNGDDLSSLSIELPAGELVNPQSVATPCPTANFNADTCAASTQVGTISVSYRVAGKINTATGSVYSITPDANSVINFGFIVRPTTSFQKFLFTSGRATGLTTVRSDPGGDFGLTILIPSIPRTIKSSIGISTAMTISNISIALNPKSGATQSGSYFTFNPTRCTPATSRATFTSYSGVVSTQSSAFTPTGCDQVKLDPTFSIAATNTAAGQSTGMSATVRMPVADQPIQESHIKDVVATLQGGTTIDLDVLNAVSLCTDAQLAADACPAASRIGSASVNVPFLPAPMTGDIYLMSRQGVQFAYILRGARGTTATLRGSAKPVGDGNGDATVEATFQTLPQAPWSNATLNFTSLILKNPPNSCPYATAWADITGYSGSRTIYGTFYNQTGCPPPDTSLTTTVSGTIQSRTPKFEFTAIPAAGASFECSVDSGAFSACATPYTTASLADGAHTFAVRAIKGDLTDPTPATASFTVDGTPPTITIGKPAAGEVLTSSTVKLVYATEPGATNTCWLDSGPAVVCPTSKTFTNVADGAHQFVVIARDAAGNQAVLVRHFTVAVPKNPIITLRAPANGSTIPTNSMTTDFSVVSPSGAAITSVVCTFYDVYIFDPSNPTDTYDQETLAPAAGPCNSGTTYTLDETTLKKLKIDVTDANGLTSTASTTFTTGILPPSNPRLVDTSNYSGGRVSDRTPTFALLPGDTRWPNTTYECSIAPTTAAPVWVPCGSPTNLPPFKVTQPMTDGDWTFRTRASSGSVVGPASSMTFTVGPWNAVYNASTSTQAAGAHPDLDVQITPDKAGQFRTIDLTLPKGLIGSLTSFPECPAANVATAACSDATKIGSVDVAYEIAGSPPLPRTDGVVYFTEPQDPADVAGMVIRVNSPHASFANVIIPLRVQLINNSQQMRVFSDTIPTVVKSTQSSKLTNFWVDDFKMHVNGSQGTGFPLLTNPSNCAASLFTGTFGDTVGNKTPALTIPYQATNCAALPFAPTISQSLTGQTAGQQVGLTADVNLPLGSASMKSLTVTEPVALTPRLASFGEPDDQCNAAAAPLPSSTFDPSFCPTQAAVGTMSIDSPLLAAPLTGKVYLIYHSPLPWLGVALDGQGLKVRIVGVTSTPLDDPTCDPSDPDQKCDSDVRVGFVNLPDLPYTHARVILDGPDRTGITGTPISTRILQIAQSQDSSCRATGSAKTTFVPNSGGANATGNQNFSFTGCAGN